MAGSTVRARCHAIGCKVSYLQDRSQIVPKASDLNVPIDTSDRRLLKVLTVYCQVVLKEHGIRYAELLQKVERRIVDLLPKGTAKAKVIATDLGMSERTLIRQLWRCSVPASMKCSTACGTNSP
jgi:hypothetical protein